VIGRWIFVRERALSRRGWLALAGLTGVGLIALLPLRVAVGLAAPDNVTARSIEGSMWDGRIGDLRVGPLPLGTLDAGMNPLALLMGRAEFDLRRDGAAPFAAVASTSGNDVRLSGLNGEVALPDGLGGLPVTALTFARFFRPHDRREMRRCPRHGGHVACFAGAVVARCCQSFRQSALRGRVAGRAHARCRWHGATDVEDCRQRGAGRRIWC
jgi:hypothetical protein